MTMEQFLKLLEGADKGKELTEFINAHLASIDETSKAEVGKRNKENQTLRERTKQAEAKATALQDKAELLAGKLGVDLDDEDLDGSLEKASQGKGKEADPQLMRRLEKLEKQLKAEREAGTKSIAEEKAKRHDLLLRKSLQDALAENKAIRPDQLVELLKGRAKVGEDDSVVFVSDKGDEVDIKTGVKAYMDQFPEFRSNSQAGGAGSGGSTGEKGGKEDPGVALAKSLAKQANQADQSAAKARAAIFGTPMAPAATE